MKKYLKSEYIGIPILIAMISFIIFYAVLMRRDGDILFIISNGREIVKNGIPKVNPYVWMDNYKIVIQQWLLSVFYYFGYKGLGFDFIWIETLIGLSIEFFLVYKITRFNSNVDKLKSLLLSALVIISLIYIYQGKPTLWSMVLLTTQIYLCEKRAPGWFLPILVFLEANIHMSYIVFHFVYLLPYIVPGFKPISINDANKRYWKWIPIMAIMAFINPYGKDGALYLFSSYNDKLKSLDISELQALGFDKAIGVIGITVIIFVCMKVYNYYKNGNIATSSKFYCFIGSIALIFLFHEARNYIFVILGALPIYTSMYMGVTIKESKFKNILNWICWILCTIVLFFFVIAIPIGLEDKYPFLDKMPAKSVEYLQDKDVKLFNDFNTGAYFEFNNVKCFIDARPELYFKSINGVDDSEIDYNNTLNPDIKKIDNVINKYNFDYYSVTKNTTMDMYLNDRPNQYELVIKNDGNYRLYRKK